MGIRKLLIKCFQYVFNSEPNKYFKFKPMSTNQYFRHALLQYVQMNHNLQNIQNTLLQIESLKTQIAHKHKKHRRTDKEILKNFNCPHCERIYATEVALRLHLKLKHRETLIDKHSDSNTILINQSDKENLDINMEAL